MSHRTKKILLLPILLFILLWISLPLLFTWAGLPSHIRMTTGNNEEFRPNIRISFRIVASEEGIITVNENNIENGHTLRLNDTLSLNAETFGEVDLYFKLFGIIPVRRMRVNVLPRMKVVPGGQAIGVMMDVRGVVVIDHSQVLNEKGENVSPAKDAGVLKGDIITEINGYEIRDTKQVVEYIDRFARKSGNLTVKIFRSGKGEIYKTITPVKSAENDRYMLGIWIDKQASGVGTLTFYHPESNQFAALGHAVNDGLDKNLTDTSIVEARIIGINKGQDGLPGEKIGIFVNESNKLGQINQNTSYGIFGDSAMAWDCTVYESPIPVALPREVEEGPAEMLTVIDRDRVEKFDIVIERVFNHSRPEKKSMVLRITDPRLLSQTGGIVQGMSGSPIIQNDKLIGAVTHVFVSDVTRGYGVLAEWMVLEGGFLDMSQEQFMPQKPGINFLAFSFMLW